MTEPEADTPPDGVPEEGAPPEANEAMPADDRPDETGAPPAEAEVVEPVEEVDPLAELEARNAKLDEQLQRERAEFLNETKRIRRHADNERKFAIERVVVDLLPVVDALHSARAGLGEGEAADRLREGLDLIEKQLATVLERHGVEPIEALGQPFDPNRHQAIMMVENPEFEPRTVCEVLRPGYALKGRVVRPAEVLVTPGGEEEPPEPQAGSDEDASDGEPSQEDASREAGGPAEDE